MFVCAISLTSCKTDAKEKTAETAEGQKVDVKATGITYTGEFIHVDTAAVLKGNSFIYGVKMDEMSKQLITEVEDVKNDEYDVINVVVKGELNKNTEEGWEEIITITSIEKVFPPNQTQEEQVIRYSSEKSE
jgi:hypothetical protein